LLKVNRRDARVSLSVNVRQDRLHEFDFSSNGSLVFSGGAGVSILASGSDAPYGDATLSITDGTQPYSVSLTLSDPTLGSLSLDPGFIPPENGMSAMSSAGQFTLSVPAADLQAALRAVRFTSSGIDGVEQVVVRGTDGAGASATTLENVAIGVVPGINGLQNETVVSGRNAQLFSGVTVTGDATIIAQIMLSGSVVAAFDMSGLSPDSARVVVQNEDGSLTATGTAAAITTALHQVALYLQGNSSDIVSSSTSGGTTVLALADSHTVTLHNYVSLANS